MLEYDSADRVTRTRVMMKTAPGSGTTHDIGDGWMDSRLEYNAVGQVTKTKDDGNHETITTYDGLGRVSVLEDPIGNKTTFTYDSSGNVLTRKEEEKEDGGSTFDTYLYRFEYDNLNRMTKSYDPANNASLFTYDARNLVTVEDANGHKVFSAFDEQKRLIQTRVQQAGTNEITTALAYDKNSRLTKVTDAVGNDTLYFYDPLDRQTKQTFEDGYDLKFFFDANSNVITRQDQNNTLVLYTYDLANRLTEKDFVITETHIQGEVNGKLFRYDALNRLTKAEDTDSRILYTYNTASLVESEEMHYGSANKTAQSGRTVEWDYDVQGRVAAVRYPI